MAVTLFGPTKKPTICAGTPSFCFGRAHTALSMNAAALLGIKAVLGKLGHKGALTTEQFQLLKTAVLLLFVLAARTPLSR